MKRFKWILYAWIAIIALAACSDNDDNGGTNSNAEVCTVNVDVILPKDVYTQWTKSIEWMQSNLAKAQQGLDKQVKINIRYHDEDTEDLDHLGFELTHPEDGDADTCHAIIGPYRDENARHILNYAATKQKPVLLPTCVSGELQRINARSTNVWFLTESDITKCEVILSTLKSVNVKNIALIYSNDSYGQTYRDWFGFLSTEYKLNIVNNGIIRYSKGMNIQQFLEDTHKLDDDTYVILGLSSTEANAEVIKLINPTMEDTGNSSIYPVCTQNQNLISTIGNDAALLGFTSAPSPSSGFSTAYHSKFGSLPTEGEAQMYDALSIIALGEAKRLNSDNPNEKKLTDWMRDVVSYKEGANSSWTADGLATALRRYATHQNCNVSGTTGGLLFDETTHTKILQSCYQMWMLWGADMSYLGYYSTAGSNSTASTSSIWDWQKTIYDDFDPNLKVDRNLPECTDHWALLISPSSTWANYRHQADVFAMYQLLKKHGYDDDHIIVIAEDNLANSKQNAANAGKIFVEVGGANVHDNVEVDYHFSNLIRQDIADIMLGNQSDRLPKVFHTTNSSDILFFWSGHGGESDGPLWGDETADYYFGSKRIKEIVQTMHDEGKYRRMMFAIETCYSGIWGNALTGIPDVVTITAANAYEPSKADVMDRNLGVFLSNAFARSFRDAINSNPSISLRDLYLQLAKTTTGSHVSLYNESQYGSVYSTFMSDYMK